SLVRDRHGKATSAYSFDGVNDLITVNDHNNLDFGSSDFALSLWVYRKTTAGSSNAVVGKWNTTSSPGTNEWLLTHHESSTSKPRFTMESGTTLYSVSGSQTLRTYQWHHLLVQRDSTH